MGFKYGWFPGHDGDFMLSSSFQAKRVRDKTDKKFQTEKISLAYSTSFIILLHQSAHHCANDAIFDNYFVLFCVDRNPWKRKTTNSFEYYASPHHY